jgi:hypothetical protein
MNVPFSGVESGIERLAGAERERDSRDRRLGRVEVIRRPGIPDGDAGIGNEGDRSQRGSQAREDGLEAICRKPLGC